MTLLFIDGFDAQDTLTKWPGSTGVTFSSNTRWGVGYAAVCPSALSMAVPASTKIFVGLAAAPQSGGGARTLISLRGDAGATTHLNLRLDLAGTVTLLRGATVLATSAASNLVANGVWAYYEMSGTINATTGTAEVRVNGVTVITFTGNTKNGGTNSTIDSVLLQGVTTSLFDDAYIANDQGTVNNTFFGDVRVLTEFPDGPGSQTNFSPVGSATNWQNVDEVPPSSADYNYSATTGNRDLYTVQDLPPGTVSVFGVQVNLNVAKTDSGTRTAKPVLKSGATVATGPAAALTPATSTVSYTVNTNPATSAAWALADVNALEIGIEVG